MGDFRSEIEEKLPLTEDALLMSIGADLVGPQALPSLPSELAETCAAVADGTTKAAPR